MITLKHETSEMIRKEMESIPEKYHKPFNSTHEGYAVLLEEVRELEHVVFFGEKEAREEAKKIVGPDHHLTDEDIQHWKNVTKSVHKQRLREEAIQVAAMASRIIQELT